MKKSLFLLSTLFSFCLYSMDSHTGASLDMDTITLDTDTETTEPEKQSFPQIHFSPGIEEILINLIDKEQARFRGAFYRFSLYKPAKALVDGIKKRGVEISLIVDKEQLTKEFCIPLKLIIDNGGKIYKKTKVRFSYRQDNEKYENMHHKFILFDRNVDNKRLLWTGSWNATGQANKSCENVVIIDNEESIQAFEKEFGILEGISTEVTSEQCVSPKDSDSKIHSFTWQLNGIPRPIFEDKSENPTS